MTTFAFVDAVVIYHLLLIFLSVHLNYLLPYRDPVVAPHQSVLSILPTHTAKLLIHIQASTGAEYDHVTEV